MKAKAAWLPALVAFTLPACVRSADESVAEERSVARETYELLDSDSVEAAAAKVLQGMIDDIGAVKDRYPELRDWDGHEVKRRAELCGMSGFRYASRFTESKRVERFGRYGCCLSVSIVRDRMPREPPPVQTRGYSMQELRLWEELNLWKTQDHMLPSIRGYVRAGVRVGRKNSDGFVDEIDSIFDRHLRGLSDHDTRRAAATQDPHGSTRTLSVPGSAARVSASSASSSE